MTDDIKALREEISRLRERVAVLEARPQPQHFVSNPSMPPVQLPKGWPHVGTPLKDWPNKYEVTCGSAGPAR